MPDLSAAELAQGRRVLAGALLDDANRIMVRAGGALWLDHGDGNADGITGPLPVWAGGVAALMAWAVNHLPALLDAAEKATELEALLDQMRDFAKDNPEYVTNCSRVAQQLGWVPPDGWTIPTPEESSDVQ